MIRWLIAFLFTQAVEMPIYARALGERRGRWLVAFGASAITHPFVWFVFPRVLRKAGYVPMVLAAEVFAVGVEAAYFHWLGLKRPLLWSLVANAASVVLGFTARRLFGYP